MVSRRFAVVLVVLCGQAWAQHSASHWGPYYRERYLICADAPEGKAHCVGPRRAHDALLAALAVGDLAPGTNHDAQLGRAHDAAIDAVYFHLRDAVPALRGWLQLRPTAADRDQHSSLEKQALRAEAAYALAHLGDHGSAQAIAELVEEFETTGHGSLWDDTLAALAVIDPARASRYAIDFLGRARDFRMSMPGGSSKLIALDYLRPEDRDALPVLERLAKAEERGYDHAHCEFMATRVRLDAVLHAAVRKQLLGSYSGSWLAGCANAVIGRLGGDPDDAAALVRHLGRDDAGMDFGVANIAYQRILELIAAMDRAWGTASAGEQARIRRARSSLAASPERASIRRARDVLKRGLDERSRWPHVAKPGHASYALHYVALHHAALAGLGDPAAARRLDALIDDPADTTGAAWIAAYWALRLRLPDAPARAGALIARGVGYANGERRGIYQDLRARVLEAFAEAHPDDPRWTVLLLDADRSSKAAEEAQYRLARTPPRGSCEAVAGAARAARPEAVEHALLALTVLGDTCRPAIGQLFDSTASPEVRGAALEFLAVLESPSLCDQLARARRDGVWRPAIERAELLAGTRCGKPPVKTPPVKAPPRGKPLPRSEQPLPPRSHRQGF